MSGWSCKAGMCDLSGISCKELHRVSVGLSLKRLICLFFCLSQFSSTRWRQTSEPNLYTKAPLSWCDAFTVTLSKCLKAPEPRGSSTRDVTSSNRVVSCGVFLAVRILDFSVHPPLRSGSLPEEHFYCFM